ncbi:Serine/threonine protein kinase [Haloechinothrix alba]|uniref:non-specific serine/threonine protein kinase n=1 Tax=Haloechinothrix alba TaxID=664784 RepID=A0A238WJT7_9PSEU|nr:serine/threonine-protein kinase [Haloechinothrix alba]SNR46747.1 Serine/threonine protein kinase [Haloechinothrix alba]
MAQRKVINERYELQRLPLARGGMGEVWEGRDTKLDREIAVKFVRFPDGVPDDELIRRFVRESRITARLQHPGVPAVFDVGTEDGRPYLVMQRIRGLSVADLLDQHERLPVGWATAIAAQACSVLAVAHHASLVHRDLKPANLMLEPDGTVKVLDFGLAVALDLADVSQITRSGQHIGTPAYMAPEQVLAAMSGPQTDIYALGCTLHEMLTGAKLFTGTTQYAVMNKQVDEPPTPVRDIRPEVPAGLDSVIGAMLEKKPEDRPSTAQDTYESLLPYVESLEHIPGVLHPPAIPSPTQMYATVLSRAFTPTPQEQTAPDTAQPPTSESQHTLPATAPEHSAGTPSSSTALTGDTAAGHATRSSLAETRAEASELVRQSRYSQAAELLSETIRSARESFGPLDDDVINLRLEWANVLFEGGDYRTAAPAYQALKADLVERDGPDAELVFRCRLQNATCHALLGDTTTALEAMHELLADERRVFGTHDPRTIELRRQIGLLQLGAGQREAAQGTLRELLDELLEQHGEDHPAVPKVRDLLAGIGGES